MRHALCLPVQRWAESRLRAEVAGEVTAQCRGGRGAAGRCMARERTSLFGGLWLAAEDGRRRCSWRGRQLFPGRRDPW